MLDPGESPRQAAVRELEEESGQRPDRLDFTALARTWFAPQKRYEFLAIYRARIVSPATFVPNQEMSHELWWSPDQDLANLNPIDRSIATAYPPAGSSLTEAESSG